MKCVFDGIYRYRTDAGRVRNEPPTRNDPGKTTNLLLLGNSGVSVTSIDAAFKKPATTLQEAFKTTKPELLTLNGTLRLKVT